MIRLAAAPITNLASLKAALQNALRLEFFTIPPYLTAHHTLSGRSSGAQFARSTIRSIVREEMLHMNLVCNILNAIGGTPDIKAAVPTYPNPLPMALAGGLKVHLKRYSRQLVEHVFMEIEEPKTPIEIPVKHELLAAAVAPQTIGEFYGLIRNEIIRQAGDGIFTGPAEREVNLFFTSQGSTVVNDLATALRAIDIIVEQGEGTPQSPLDLQHDIAHYYRFQQLAKAMQLKPLPSPHFDPAEPLAIDDDADVTRMVDDPQHVIIDPIDANARNLSDACDEQFSQIVDTLHVGFSEDREQLSSIDDAMIDFAGNIDQLMAEPLTAGPHAGFHAGPRFLYTPAPRP
jgi:hypothetical protein